ncbi:hypothetical protein ACOMHN_045041 [Nucella lapillus]
MEWTMRSVLGASLLMYLITFAMAIRENCCAAIFYTCCLAGRKTEVLAFVAEMLGIAGVMLYSLQEYQTVGDFSRLYWAHALCDFGLAVSLIGSIMMACAQQSLPAAKAAAGRIVAKPGYESLANNNRSASMQSRSTHCTQASPFQGRTTPHISGPYPSPAAIAAVNAAVSPKQQRANAINGPQHRKLSSPTPYPALDSNHCTASPSRRRKSSAQEKQFAGLHNQSKHPPVFSSEHVQEDWCAQQQSYTWSESMRAEEPGVQQQRALKSQMELEQAVKHHSNTWSTANGRERAWGHGPHTEQNHYDRDWRDTSHSQPFTHPHPHPHPNPHPHLHPHPHPNPHPQLHPHAHPNLPPPPAPPSAVAPANAGTPAKEGYQDYPPPDGRQVQAGYQYPGPGYGDGQWPQPPSQQYLSTPHHHQPRPDSGNFPDPPPPEQLLCYEEERSTETVSYQGFPTPVPGDVMPPPPGALQPVALYRAPSQPAHCPVIETVAIRPQGGYPPAPSARPPAPHASPALASHHPHQQHPHYPYQPHQTFPRQQPAHPPAVNPNVYSTYRR